MNSPPDRFVRQQGLVPQSKLQDLTFTIIGVGAIGRQVAVQLAAIGSRRVQLIDFDAVEPTNITTQGYFEEDLGLPKVEATARLLRKIDSQIEISSICDRYRTSLSAGEVVFCCVDSISARAAIWRSLGHRCRFWCDGRMLGEVMRILTAVDERSRAHYSSTLFRQSEAQTGACTSRSTIYTVNIAAGMMIHQLARWLRQIPTVFELSLSLLASELTTGEGSR